MPSEFLTIFRDLCAPFAPGEVKQRSQAGRQFSYITARHAMNRLDEVLGPENWWDHYIPRNDNSIVCELTIRLPDGRLLTKADCGGNAGMSDEGDDEKSAFSDAFKRAAVKFGVGRHLYNDGLPNFAGGEPGGRSERPPPRAAPPHRPAAATPPARAPEARPAPDFGALPKAGSPAAFWWFKNLGDHFSVQLARKAEELANAEGLPNSFKEWDQATLDRMARRAIAFCRQLPSYKGELDALAGGSTPPAEAAPAPTNVIEGARGAMYTQAAMLFAATSQGGPATAADIQEIVAEVSGGKIADFRACQDAPLMAQTSQAIQRLRQEKTRRD